MNDPAEPPSHNEGRAFRWTVGLLVLLTAIVGFGALFVVKVPVENKDAMMFALGAIFGWASSVVASEYGSTTTGRKIAESAIRSAERQEQNTSPAGTPDDPLSVAGAADNAEPVKTKDAKP